MQELTKKKKNQYIAKMWLIHPACFRLHLIRKLYYRKVEVAFLSKGNVPTSEKWGRGMPRSAPLSFPTHSLWVCWRLPSCLSSGAHLWNSLACTWAVRRSRPSRNDACPFRNQKAWVLIPFFQFAAWCMTTADITVLRLVSSPVEEIDNCSYFWGAWKVGWDSETCEIWRLGPRDTSTSNQFKEQKKKKFPVGAH